MVIGLAALLQAGSSAWAQDVSPSPSPKELWEAYPLEPDQVPPTATPSAEFRASASATPRAAASDDDESGTPWIVVVLLAAPLVFGAGLLIGYRRSRAPKSSSTAANGSAPSAPRRFQWRDYPEPARPAPPPPPVPGGRGPSFEVGLKEERAAASSRQKQKEPH